MRAKRRCFHAQELRKSTTGNQNKVRSFNYGKPFPLFFLIAHAER